jgi:hypothetical protein
MKTIYYLSILLFACTVAIKAQTNKTEASLYKKKMTSKTTFTTSESGWSFKENTWWHNDTVSAGEPETYILTDTIKERYVDDVSHTDSCFITTRSVKKIYSTSEEDWEWNGYIWLYKGLPANEKPKKITTRKIEETVRKPIDCKELDL